MTTWPRVRLDWLVNEERRTSDPGSLGSDTVFHYSIPVFDDLGDGQLEPAAEIGSGKLVLSGGEVLISKLNPRLPRVLKAEAHDFPTVASTEFIALRPGPRVEDRFLRYWLVSELLRQRLDGATMSVTRSQQRIRPETLTKMWVAFPSLREQVDIADFLDAETTRIDAVIGGKQLMTNLLGQRANAVISLLIGGSVVWGSDGIPVPDGPDRAVRLGAVATIHSGLTLDAGRDPGETQVARPYLRVANVQDGCVDLTEVKDVTVPLRLARRCELRPGDVLMTEGGDADKLGRGTVWEGQVPGCLHQNHVFAVRPSGALDPSYLALLTRTEYARAYFEVTATKTTGIASTSTSKIAAFRVPLPDLARQRTIVEGIREQLVEVERLHSAIVRQIALLREHRQALITAAVTGELDIPGTAA